MRRLLCALCASLLLAAALVILPGRPARADTLTDTLTGLENNLTVPLTDWKFHQPDVPGGEQPGFDDSAWQTVQPGSTWSGENSHVWFRARLTVPATVGGFPVNDTPIHLRVGMDDDGEIYINGALVQKFHWDDGNVLITEHARPGEVYVIAIRGSNGPGTGGLHFARLTYDALAPLQPAYDQYVQEAGFVDALTKRAPAAQQAQIAAALKKSESQVDLDALHQAKWDTAKASLAAARQTLLTLQPITRQYDVYYVGHAHIDMNWLWTWPETLDVCHRTWDSAMKLMGQFPDFGYVQSQPGAYAPIQNLYPAEFARMQQAQKRGQWDVVGGLWDESDTNMPSGEALARSLFLGQRYFKSNFGQYAKTGWLPDSFGHSWQLPQLMQLAGMQNFYHMRCGDGVRYSWWESPDGSRVLKANTDSYDAPIVTDQLSQPWQNQQSYGLKEALVVFGVGDHGGGPTRAQILQGKAFQNDPLFPKVHFVTADAYFQRLRAEPSVKSLPVVDTDLQYVFTGCYTTHADLKKAVRDSENNLYAAEVFSSLASLQGQAYPVQGFEAAWKPTAFAQFHDIMCGSAIHSTYTWMHEQLKPAFAFEKAQTQKALTALTAHVDTRDATPGETPVVVWNALSFPRTDVVRVSSTQARRYHSVRDSAGGEYPAQALDAGTLVFVAHAVPAFGHKTYFLSTKNAARSGKARNLARGLTLENGFLRVTVAKATGLVTSLYDKKNKREMIAPGKAGDLLQVLGDRGSAWDINYTGERHDLTTGADVKLIASGPVCAIVRVRHTFGKSIFKQDITLYNDLPRVDIPTTVQWHEHGQLLKVAFPLNMTHPAARVGIPYGSIDRPDNGQENPGQKWMDVTEDRVTPVAQATPLALSKLFNSSSTQDFDTQGRSFAPELFPPTGRRKIGPGGVPFLLPATGNGVRDNIACAGQTISVPSGARGAVLYLLGAGALGTQGGALTVVSAQGKRFSLPVSLGDWVTGNGQHNAPGLNFAYRLLSPGAAHDKAAAPHLWIAAVPLPQNSRIARIILPANPKAHLFAATIGAAQARTPLYGLSVLNNCKYGSDTNGNVFRLTLLRSSQSPDPNPDEGRQVFTYSLLPHAGDWRAARSEQAGLQLNIPLYAVTASVHPSARTASVPTFVQIAPSGNLVAGALKHAEDGRGYILRLFETQGRNTVAHLTFPRPVRVEETDILERPLHRRRIQIQGRQVTFPVGHDQIVTLHITGLPDAKLHGAKT